jgi:L-seryl-tRNA(Ser) seleniumtransferase
VLRGYLFGGDPRAAVHALGQILADPDALRRRADAVAKALTPAAVNVAVEDDDAAVGGGSLAGAAVPSAAVVLRCGSEKAAVALARRLRLGDPSVFPRIKGREVRINMITILPAEDAALVRVLESALAGEGAE